MSVVVVASIHLAGRGYIMFSIEWGDISLATS